MKGKSEIERKQSAKAKSNTESKVLNLLLSFQFQSILMVFE